MPLEVTGYKNEAVSADLERIPVNQSSTPAEYANYNCFTSLYRGFQEVLLAAN